MRWLCVVAALWASVASAEVKLFRPADLALDRYGQMLMKVGDALEKLESTMNREAGGGVVRNIVFRQCGEENAFFQYGGKEIVMCYEMMREYERRSGGDMESVFLSTVHALLHEYGHALTYARGGEKVFANEEDSADAIAAALIRKAGMTREYVGAIVGGMRGALLRDVVRVVPTDDHGYDMKRRANTICWIAGGDGAALSEAVERGYLSAARAGGCIDEANEVTRRVDEIMAMRTPLSAGRAGW